MLSQVPRAECPGQGAYREPPQGKQCRATPLTRRDRPAIGIVARIEDYQQKLAAEVAVYNETEEVHELPSIHNLWAARFILPLLQNVGVASIDDLWDRHVMEQCARRAPERARLVSLGAGNGEVELPLAARLADRGVTNLELVLLELNPTMLERAESEARRLGLEDRVRTERTDLNSWVASERADVYLATHSLHHIVELEHLYDEVVRSLDVDGVFLVNDMIGRNGHRRWPEALDLVRRIWRGLPARYRFNHSLKQIDDEYPDLDCSTVGFEGVRSQDVLPLLLERAHPLEFVIFGNIIDPFVDRIYGPNFDPEDRDDAAFIDAVARLDEAAIDLGLLTPTHMIASFRSTPGPCRYPGVRSPLQVIRRPDDPSLATSQGRESDGPAAPAAGVAMDNGLGTLNLAELHAELGAARAQFEALRNRKSVQIAVRLADLRHRVGRTTSHSA